MVAKKRSLQNRLPQSIIVTVPILIGGVVRNGSRQTGTSVLGKRVPYDHKSAGSHDVHPRDGR